MKKKIFIALFLIFVAGLAMIPVKSLAADTTTAPSSTNNGLDAAALQNLIKSLENKSNSPTAGQTQAQTQTTTPSTNQSQQQVDEYYAQQTKLLNQLKEEQKTTRIQNIILGVIQIISLIFAWIFFWYAIGALRLWIRHNK